MTSPIQLDGFFFCDRKANIFERIVPLSDVSQVVSDLMSRVVTGTDVVADDVSCRVERLDFDALSHAKLPDISTWQVSDFQGF